MFFWLFIYFVFICCSLQITVKFVKGNNQTSSFKLLFDYLTCVYSRLQFKKQYQGGNFKKYIKYSRRHVRLNPCWCPASRCQSLPTQVSSCRALPSGKAWPGIQVTTHSLHTFFEVYQCYCLTWKCIKSKVFHLNYRNTLYAVDWSGRE
jgi:hypothetical protein